MRLQPPPHYSSFRNLDFGAVVGNGCFVSSQLLFFTYILGTRPSGKLKGLLLFFTSRWKSLRPPGSVKLVRLYLFSPFFELHLLKHPD